MNVRMIAPAVAALVLTAGAAQAAPMLEFDDVSGQTGTISYNADTGILTGSGIDFDTFRAVDVMNAGEFECQSCELNFSTNASVDGGFLSITGGGQMTIMGTIVLPDTTVSGTLVSGSFTSGALLDGPQTNNAALNGFGNDSKAEDLVSYFGLGPDFSFATTQILLDAGLNISESFEVGVDNADFNNSPVEVPEPATLGMLAAGLIGVGAARRRRVKNAA